MAAVRRTTLTLAFAAVHHDMEKSRAQRDLAAASRPMMQRTESARGPRRNSVRVTRLKC
jgi:hypothetical protein